MLTIQKLRARLEELGKMIEGAPSMLAPVYAMAASGPVAMPSPEDERWLPVEVGSLWGANHGTGWLMARLRVPESMQGLPIVLQLLSDASEDDPFLLVLEATVFLDGRAAGGIDRYHPGLLLEKAVCDGAMHTLMLQVCTESPLHFGGLSLRPRHVVHRQLYNLMQTLLDVCLTLDEDSVTRHALEARLNTAYTMLDLREGWLSERFIDSARAAYDYLRAHLTQGLEGGNRVQITASGHAHLDLGWMWPYWRTRQKIAHAVATVLALMENYPDCSYSQSQPQLLQWLKEDVPELYARVKQRVAEGRFEPVGAMWVEADCNLPGGESLIRQIMQGLRFWQEEFGVKPRQIWLPDAFGFSAALPQMMRGCDIPVFMTTKMSWNQVNRMPYDTFRWRGIDGSEVLAHFITTADLDPTKTFSTYNGSLQPGSITATWRNYRQQDCNDHLLYLYGWGDGGGGPTEEQVARLQLLANLRDFPQVRSGRVDDYFSDLYWRVWENPCLPTWVGELYLEYHRGTYTSQAHIKQQNRRAELLYREAELLNAWAGLYGMPSRQEQLNVGWRLLLLNQFHDVLPGSSIPEVYEDARRLYAEARAIGKQIYDEALAVVLGQVTAGEGDLLLLNTLPWERIDPVQVPEAFARYFPRAQQATDWDGNTVCLLDGIRVPSCGVQVVPAGGNVVAGDVRDRPACHASYTGEGAILLRNQYYDLWIDAQGEMSRLYDRSAERDVLAAGETGNRLIAYEDRPLNFDAWDIDLFYEEKPYPLRAVTAIRIIEQGPVRVTVEVVRHYLSSSITQRISLWRGSPRIDIATQIDWHEHQTLLKAAFPLAINSTRATYEIQFGSVERPTHRNTSWDMARFETCAQRWIDMSEGGYGVSLLNDGKYGHDVHDNVVRLTLLKSSSYPDSHADEGLHRFTYSLLPHGGDWREAQSVRRAYELNVPLLCVNEQKTMLAASGSSAGVSFLQTDCAHVVVETVKPAEDGDGLIVRLYEAHNRRGHGTLTFAAPVLSAQECNLLEEPLNDVPSQGKTLPFWVRPFEIKTWRVRLAR
ncbi:MAG TPA: alpha-mannosidase [Ktedonobacteraceae bacterium]|nr:alpha-mannosidase [Ktedonobacteraceae bacterium]